MELVGNFDGTGRLFDGVERLFAAAETQIVGLGRYWWVTILASSLAWDTTWRACTSIYWVKEVIWYWWC